MKIKLDRNDESNMPYVTEQDHQALFKYLHLDSVHNYSNTLLVKIKMLHLLCDVNRICYLNMHVRSVDVEISLLDFEIKASRVTNPVFGEMIIFKVQFEELYLTSRS